MKQWLVWMIAWMMFSSCQHEMILPFRGDEVIDRGDSIEMTVALEHPSMELLATKGLSTIDEKTLKNLTILVFNESTGNETFSYKVSPLALYNDGSFRVRLKKTTNKVRLVLLSNYDNSAQTAINIIAVGASKATALSSVLYNTASAFRSDGTIGIPMWGESHLVILNENLALSSLGAGLDGAIVMHRSLLKIDVTNGATAYFQLTSVRIYNSRTQSNMIPSAVGTLSPAGTVNPAPLVYTLTGGDLAGQSLYNSIYIAETQIADNTSLIIGGKYNGATSETYYKIPLTTNTNPTPLLRNHSYEVTIESVLNNGFFTAEDALDGTSPALKTSVVLWGERRTDTTIQGEHTLVVSESNLYFPQWAGSVATMTCLASAGFVVDPIGLPPDYTVAITSGNGEQGELSTISVVSSENTGALRSGYFTIRSGFISKRINIEQSGI